MWSETWVEIRKKRKKVYYEQGKGFIKIILGYYDHSNKSQNRTKNSVCVSKMLNLKVKEMDASNSEW